MYSILKRIKPHSLIRTVVRISNSRRYCSYEAVPEKSQLERFTVSLVEERDHKELVQMLKRHYLKEHVLMKMRRTASNDQNVFDEYIHDVLKQGGSVCARAENGDLAGVCANLACGPTDLRSYAFYKKDVVLRELLFFTAKLQETPNLWNMLNVDNIFEIKMLTVLPEFRQQGLATSMVEKSKELAEELGYKVVRFDCIKRYDYKIAENCEMQCIANFRLHKIRGLHGSYVKIHSMYNCPVRVYIHLNDHDQEVFEDEKMHIGRSCKQPDNQNVFTENVWSKNMQACIH